MKTKEFEQLLQRYLDGNCNEEERLKVEQWFDQLGAENIDLEEKEKSEIKERMLRRIIEIKSKEKPAVERRLSIGMPILYKVAASLLLVLTSFFVYQHFQTSGFDGSPEVLAAEGQEEIVIENDDNSTREVWLPDGTQVILKGKGKISYLKPFAGKKREVYLDGEAFFDVIRNPESPFFVYSGNIVTRVLGTSFTMIAQKDAPTIEVNVVSGRVSVYESEEAEPESANDQKKVKKGVILTRNQKATFFVKENHLVTSLVEEPAPEKIPTRENKLLVFEDNTLSEIAIKLEENYSIEFVMDNASLSNCTFTGDLSDMSLFDVLSVICKSVGAEYEVMGTKILMNGEGCQKLIVD